MICRWCDTGKPPEVTEPHKNPNCHKCAKKPDSIDGKRLRTIAEIKAGMRPKRIDWDKVRAARAKARVENVMPMWKGART